MSLATHLFEEELRRATQKFPTDFNSPHEGFAVIAEEMDELWEEVRGKADGPQAERRVKMAHEVVQVGAMCLRFLRSFYTDEQLAALFNVGFTPGTIIDDRRLFGQPFPDHGYLDHG